jgi:hypothetical protein
VDDPTSAAFVVAMSPFLAETEVIMASLKKRKEECISSFYELFEILGISEREKLLDGDKECNWLFTKIDEFMKLFERACHKFKPPSTDTVATTRSDGRGIAVSSSHKVQVSKREKLPAGPGAKIAMKSSKASRSKPKQRHAAHSAPDILKHGLPPPGGLAKKLAKNTLKRAPTMKEMLSHRTVEEHNSGTFNDDDDDYWTESD